MQLAISVNYIINDSVVRIHLLLLWHLTTLALIELSSHSVVYVTVLLSFQLCLN